MNCSTRYILITLLLYAVSLVHAQSSSCLGDWCQPDTDEDNWCFSPQLGWVYEANCPWVFINGKGWFYVDEASEADGELWLFNNSNDWLFTSEDVFPFMYSNLVSDWITYFDLTLTVGTVSSGNQAVPIVLPNYSVTLFFSDSTDEPQALAEWTTDANGQFNFSTPLVTDEGVYYFVADNAENSAMRLAANLSDDVFPETIVINELTTVATAFCFNQFLNPLTGDIRGSTLALEIAAAMSGNLVDIQSGNPSQVLLNPPNANQTNALRSTRSLANMIAAALANDDGELDEFLSLTALPDSPANQDTLLAMQSIARNPNNNLDSLYLFSQKSNFYEPGLFLVPDAWTLAVKVNDTGSTAKVWSGSANTVFDERGYAWINNNTVQGLPISDNFIVVLKPDGSPSDGEDGTPVSPIVNDGILGPGFGIAQNPIDSTIWVANFGWGGLNPGPGSVGSVAQFALDGTPISPDDAYQGGTNRVQGIIVDGNGNVWNASFGNDRIVVFLDGDPNNAIFADLDCKPFGLAEGPDGSVWCGAIGADEFLNQPGECSSRSSVSRWRINDDETGLIQIFKTEVGRQNKGIDIDFEGYGWVASGIADRVYRISPEGDVVGEFQGGGMNAPWSIRIDDAGDVWVTNFGKESFLPGQDVYTNPGLTKLAGPNSPSGQSVGTPLTPSTGYTLPSGGDPVLLSDGTPLYTLGQPGFIPLMRMVTVIPDRAGNLWATNNWKPNFYLNIFGQNGDPATADPGGDGVVIFIGLAAPTEPGRTQ